MGISEVSRIPGLELFPGVEIAQHSIGKVVQWPRTSCCTPLKLSEHDGGMKEGWVSLKDSMSVYLLCMMLYWAEE